MNSIKKYSGEVSLILLTFAYLLYQDIDRHWLVNDDEEIFLAFQGMLFSSGLKATLFEWPGFPTFFLLSIFYKINYLLSFFSIPDFQTFNQINLDESLQEIAFFTRLFAATLSSIFIIIFYNFFQSISGDKISAYLFSLALGISHGYLSHVIELRTELLTSLLFFCSIIFILKFYKSNGYIAHFYIFVSFVFLFVSIINKSQIYFYFPILIFVSFYGLKKQIDMINFKNKILSFKKYKFCILMIVILSLIFIGSEQYPSTILLLIYLFYMNCLFFLYSKFFRQTNLLNMYILNVYLLLAFIFVYLIVILHPSGTHEFFWPFFRVSKIRGVLATEDLQSCCEMSIWIKGFIVYLFTALYMALKHLIGLNYQNFLIYFNIFLIFLYYKKISNFIKLSSVLILLSFFGTEVISYFRSAPPQYDIFADIFLLLSLGLIFTSIFNKKIIRIFSIIMFFCLIYINHEIITKKTTANFSLKKEAVCQKEHSTIHYWKYWYKSISLERVSELCDW